MVSVASTLYQVLHSPTHGNLVRFVHKSPGKLPKENHRLSGRPAVDTQRGIVYWGITSEHHDDNYSGEGLWWDELENTCECMEEWGVGKGVTKEHCLEFMEECGIELDHHLNDEDCGMDSSLANDVDSDQETATCLEQRAAVLPGRGAQGRLASFSKTRLWCGCPFSGNLYICMYMYIDMHTHIWSPPP